MTSTPDFSVSIGGQPLTNYLHSLFAADFFAQPQAPPTVSLSHTDNAGGESDKFEITFARSGTSAPPKSGDEVLVKLGYKETGLVDKGKFIVDQPSSNIDKSGGRTITITATSADMTGKLKEPRHEGYKERKVGAVVRRLQDATASLQWSLNRWQICQYLKQTRPMKTTCIFCPALREIWGQISKSRMANCSFWNGAE